MYSFTAHNIESETTTPSIDGYYYLLVLVHISKHCLNYKIILGFRHITLCAIFEWIRCKQKYFLQPQHSKKEREKTVVSHFVCEPVNLADFVLRKKYENDSDELIWFYSQQWQ